MSFWPFRKINEHKNYVVNTKGKFENSEIDNSKDNVFNESKQLDESENNCTEEYLDFPIDCGVMERLKGGHYLKDISHGCQPEKVKGDIPNLAGPNKNQNSGLKNPQALKRTLRELALNTNELIRSFSRTYKNQDSCSNSLKAFEEKSEFYFENAKVQQFLGRIDLGDMYPLDVYYVEVPSNEQAFNLEDKLKPNEDKKEDSSDFMETKVSKKQEKYSKRAKGGTVKCTQKRLSNNSQDDINRESSQTCQSIKYCCKPLDCTQPMLYRCSLKREEPSCSNKADKCKELKDYLKRAEDNQQCDVEEGDQETCKPTKYCCERVDFKQDCSCGCKKPLVYRCTPFPSDPPCTEKSKVCKELEDYLQSAKNAKRESSYNKQNERVSQSGQAKNDRYSLRKSNEYKQEDDVFKDNANRQGDASGRASQAQQPSRSLDNQNGRSSFRNSSEYKQQKDSLRGVGEDIPRESSNNYQRNSSLRASQTNPTDKPLDSKNGRSSLRKSGEYTQQNDYLTAVADEAPMESSNNSQRDSSARTSQAQSPDKSLDQNERSSFRKSKENYVKTEDEIEAAENIQRGSSKSSQGDARVSQTRQSLKRFDRKEDLEESKRSVSEDISETCQPVKYSCKRLDCTQYPPCMIKPKGYKQPAVFSCRRCGPNESTSCSDRSGVCKELEDYLQSIRQKRKRESADKNQENQPKEVLDPKADRPSLRKSHEYKQEDGVEKEILPDDNMPEEYSNNNQGDASGRASQTERPSRSLDNHNGRSSFRNSNEYKQQKDSLRGVGEDIPKESSNNYQRNSSLRPSQNSDKPLDNKNGSSSLRKSGEYSEQNDYLTAVENEAPMESSNNSQRDSSGRTSQAQSPDKSIDLQNGRSSFRKSKENYVKTEDEIEPAENIQRGSSKSSQGDARVSQTRQSFKTFDRKEDLEETKRSVSEDVSKTCQPIKYSCKRLDCTQYPPCMIKPKGYKQPAVFSCRRCGPNEATSCSDRYNACKELEDYLLCIKKKNVERASSDNNKKDQPKEAFDSKKDRSSLRKSNEYKQEDNDLNGVEKEILRDQNIPEEYSNNNQEDGSGRASQKYQPFETLNSKEDRSSLRKSNNYKQREDANGRASQNYQPIETLDSKEGRTSLRKSNEYKQRESYAKTMANKQNDANGRESQSYQPVETLDSKEGRSSLRKSNEFKQQVDTNGRESQSYHPVETLDSKEGRSSLRKSNEYKQQDNGIKTERENIQRGSSKSSQGDARVSQTSQAVEDFECKEDGNNVSKQTIEGSQTNKYCCEPIDLTKCQPCPMKGNTCTTPRLYRCWPYDTNQDSSSKRKSNACSKKTNESKQPVICCCRPSSNKCKEFECKTPCEENQPCLIKVKTCKIPAKCCCRPCQPKPDPCCQKKTNKCKEPNKYRRRSCDSKGDPLDLMKTQVIKQLIDFLKDLKEQLASAKMMQMELLNTNKSDANQNGCHIDQSSRPSQGKRISDKYSPNLVQKNGRKQNENDLQNLNDKEMPSESCDARQQEKIKEITSPATNTLRKSSDVGLEVLCNGTQKETPHVPAALIQNISSDTVQPVSCCTRKKGGCTPSKNKHTESMDSCKCQEYRPFDPNLQVSDSTNANVHTPRHNVNDVKDIKKEIPSAISSQNNAISANKLDLKARKEESPISKNILRGRRDSSETGTQTEQAINMQSAKAPHKHILNIAPIRLTIPLKLMINSQDGQTNIIGTELIFEATSGAQNQESKTAMPLKACCCLNNSVLMPDSNSSDAFFSCQSGSGIMEEFDRLATVEKQNKCDATVSKPAHMQDDSDSDVFFPCLSESDLTIAEPPSTVKPQNIVELAQQTKEGTNSCTIIPTTVPPSTNSVNQQTKTESGKSFKTLASAVVKQVKEQTQPNAIYKTLPAYAEPRSESKWKRYSTPIDYQGIPVHISQKGRSQSKSTQPAVADKATSTSYISGRQLRDEMRTEIQEQLKELLELKDTNAKHKYDAQERDAILLELHKLFNPDMVDLLPQEIIKETTLTSIRYLLEPGRLSSTDKEILKLSEQRILEDIRHIIFPKSGQSDGARKFHKEFKFKVLENLRIILNSRKQERSSDADIRKNIMNDLNLLLGTGEVNKSLELGHGTSSSQGKDQKCQQRPSPQDVTSNLQADNKQNQENDVEKESLSNSLSEDLLIDNDSPVMNRKSKKLKRRKTKSLLVTLMSVFKYEIGELLH